MPSILGIDLGGTKTALARYDAETWERQEHEIMSTNAARGFPKVFENIIETAQRLCAEDTIACGMGVPGLVAQPAGIIRTLPNIPGAEGFALKKELAKRLGKPVAVDNDSNCFALAEALRGAGKWHDVVASLTLGTGVGGGLVIDGKIFHGSHGYAAEFGHMLLRPGNHRSRPGICEAMPSSSSPAARWDTAAKKQRARRSTWKARRASSCTTTCTASSRGCSSI